MSGPGNSTDYTLIPIEFESAAKVAFAPGIGSPLGAMPDIAAEYIHTKIQMKPCEFVSNPFIQGAGAETAGDSDDDDFEEDDDDDGDKGKVEATSQKKKLKLSNLS